jgi:glycosyltransferase involved in cell wall biosynthesis
MKILYVANRINADDGSSVHCRAFVKHAAILGHEVATYPRMRPLVDKPWTPSTAPRKGLVHYLKKINMRTLKAYLHKSNGYVSEMLRFIDGCIDTRRQTRGIVKMLQAFPADAIIFRHEPFNLAPFRAARQAGIPVVQEVNSLRTMEAPLAQRRPTVTALSRWAERQAIQSSSYLYAVSDPIKAAIDRYTGESKTIVIPNGVDTAFFDPAACDREGMRQSLGVGDKLVLGYVGSYKVWHGLDRAVATLELLVRKNPSYHLLLVGGGPGLQQIAALVAEKGLQESVTQIQAVPHDDIPKYMATFDLALMTYPEIENFYFSPLKMFEYMAMQLPVVSTRIGQIGDILTDGRTGILVRPADPERFADAVENAVPARRQIGRRARELMVIRYSWLENARQAMALAQQAVAGPYTAKRY